MGPLAKLSSVILFGSFASDYHYSEANAVYFTVFVTRQRVVLSLPLVWTICVVSGICIALSNVSCFPTNSTQENDERLGEVTAILTATLVTILIVCHVIIFVAVIK